jgi:DNA-binding response OmpR family regulator
MFEEETKPRKKILIVDDDPVVRVIMDEYLSASGYDVQTVSGGTECLSKLAVLKRIEGRLPDVIVLDLLMPDLNGMEVLKNIRNDEAISALPVVMLSANSEMLNHVKSHTVRADSYVQKPFEINQILKAIEEVDEHQDGQEKASELG